MPQGYGYIMPLCLWEKVGIKVTHCLWCEQPLQVVGIIGASRSGKSDIRQGESRTDDGTPEARE